MSERGLTLSRRPCLHRCRMVPPLTRSTPALSTRSIAPLVIFGVLLPAVLTASLVRLSRRLVERGSRRRRAGTRRLPLRRRDGDWGGLGARPQRRGLAGGGSVPQSGGERRRQRSLRVRRRRRSHERHRGPFVSPHSAARRSCARGWGGRAEGPMSGGVVGGVLLPRPELHLSGVMSGRAARFHAGRRFRANPLLL